MLNVRRRQGSGGISTTWMARPTPLPALAGGLRPPSAWRNAAAGRPRRALRVPRNYRMIARARAGEGGPHILLFLSRHDARPDQTCTNHCGHCSVTGILISATATATARKAQAGRAPGARDPSEGTEQEQVTV